MQKIWFITGASSGFGRSIAEEALARGENVVATARNLEPLRDLIEKYGERIHGVRLDVTKPAQVTQAFDSALERFGAVDVLVNNAGFSIVGAVEETSEDELRATMELMFFGAVNLTRALLPHMRARKTGTIVQMTSMGGLTTAPGFGAYCAAKHALEGLSECLAAEVAPFGIRVLIVEPGAFRTALFGAGFRTMPALEAYRSTVGPTREFVVNSDGGQIGDPAKAARAIADAVAAGVPTLRLPLGADAVDAIRAKLRGVLENVDKTEAVALATAFESGFGGISTNR